MWATSLTLTPAGPNFPAPMAMAMAMATATATATAICRPKPKPNHQPFTLSPSPSLTRVPTNLLLPSDKPRLFRRAAAAGEASNPKQEEGEGGEVGKEKISGSDVLWALQRAAARAQKKKKVNRNKRKKKGLAISTEASGGGEKDGHGIGIGIGIGIDDSSLSVGVRPLEIKREWSLKLDELEKRLQELVEQTPTI